MPRKPVLGITALVPPELVYACGHTPLDLNNFVPGSRTVPKHKLCAWTATWREMLIRGGAGIDSLLVVAGGDCHNALVDGQKAALATGLPTHYFFYPFSGDLQEMTVQLDRMAQFLGGVKDPGEMERVSEIKQAALELDRLRGEMKVLPSEAFSLLISGSDLGQDPDGYRARIGGLLEKEHVPGEGGKRIALIGVPPIHPDFHKACEELGLFVVHDELPYEFLRLGGRSIEELAASYSDYSFARPLDHRIALVKAEMEKRRVDGVIHYTQYACHHSLEDDLFRSVLEVPLLTIQGDLPRPVDEQLKLRLEAFYESL